MARNEETRLILSRAAAVLDNWREDAVIRWTTCLHSMLYAGRADLDEEELRNAAPLMIHRIAEALRKGEPGELEASWTQAARAHATTRYEQRVPLGDLVHEFQLLRQELWRTLRQHLAPVSSADVFILAENLDLALDTMASISTSTYTIERNLVLARERAAEVEAAQEALRESEERFRLLVMQSPDVMAGMDRDLRYTWIVNPVPPLTAEQMLGKTDFELLQREAAESMTDLKRKVLETGTTVKAEFPVAVGGEQRYYDVTYVPWRDRAGRIDGVVAYAHDITERKRAQQQLQRATSELRTLLDALPDLYFRLEDEGTILDYHAGRPADLYVTPEVFLGKRMQDVLPPDVGQQFAEAFRQLREGDALVTLEYSLPLPQGEQCFEARLTLAPQSQVALDVRNITARKQVERERERLLAEVERRAAELDAVIESMAEGVAIVDVLRGTMRINPMGLRLYGTPAAPTANQCDEWFQRLQPQHPDGSLLPLEEFPCRRVLRGEAFTEQEVRILAGDGVERSLLFAGGPVRNARGNVILAVNVFRDVTRLRQLERTREDLLRMVSHDLRSPLTTILGQAQMTQRLADRAERVRKSAGIIITSARRMNVMIQDLVDSMRLETRQLRLSRRTVDLQAFMVGLLEQVRGVLAVERISVQLPAGLPPVNADPDRLERILLNLLTNALKYSEAEVVVRARPVDGEVETSVTDRGIGIAPEDLPHVFERFYRGRVGRKTEGLGLGLYITRLLVNAHGGQIRVESEPGVGSTFSFSLPRA